MGVTGGGATSQRCWGGGGRRWCSGTAVVPRDRKSEESVSLGSYRLATLCLEQTKVINNVSIT